MHLRYKHHSRNIEYMFFSTPTDFILGILNKLGLNQIAPGKLHLLYGLLLFKYMPIKLIDNAC